MRWVFVIIIFSSCSFFPSGYKGEQEKLKLEGRNFELALDQRQCPDLPANPTWKDILQRAFLVNGELEAKYFEWKAALEEVGIRSSYPNTNLMLGYSYAFSSESMKSFDRMSFMAGVDTMENLALPFKVYQRGKVALSEARIAGEKFRQAKFELQKNILSMWAEYVVLGEKLKIKKENLKLIRLAFDITKTKTQGGALQQELYKAETELKMALNEVANTEAETRKVKAVLNGMIGRDPQASLQAPESLPQMRGLTVEDQTLIAIGSELSPDLKILAHEVEGKSNTLELIRMQWFPDINPSVSFMGSISQTLGTSVVLPSTFGRIQSQINQAKSLLQSSEAMKRQVQNDQTANFVAKVISLRNAEREFKFIEGELMQVVSKMIEAASGAYLSKIISLIEYIESQRMLNDLKIIRSDIYLSYEKDLAELEALVGVDFETLKEESHGDNK